MRIIILTIAILFPLLASGQIDFKSPPWNIGCDTLSTQLEMNTCSYESFTIADSILTQSYKKLIEYLDDAYVKEIKATSDAGDKISLDYLEILKSQKISVVASHADFIKYRDSMTDIIGFSYSGGSIRPLMENTFALELTKNQLILLKKLMDEIMH